MKKRICLLICLVLAASFMIWGNGGCSSRRPGQNRPAGVNDVIEQGMAEADGKKADGTGLPAEDDTQNRQDSDGGETQTPDAASIPAVNADAVDVDLTVLSATMVYSEVYNMMVSPEDYIGKTVKMKGRFAVYHDEASGSYYFACIIKDATACCAQGIEFVPADDREYPEGYPQVDEEICVVGVFDTYREGNYTYCTLRGAKLI